MAQYRTHNFFNCLIALPILIYVLSYFFNPSMKYIFTFSLSFLYATFFMSPDLDLAHKIKLFSLRGFLTIPFRSYSFFFKHRGVSHVFLLGTITRIFWLIIFFCAIGYLIEYSFFNHKNFLHLYEKYQDFALFGLFGIMVADFCHLLLDIKP